jgi:hypothetical protein
MFIAIISIVIISGAINHNSLKEKTTLKPIDSSNKTDNLRPLTISLSQIGNSNENLHDFNITQGNIITINVDLLLGSNQKELTIPLYLLVSSFENKPISKIITSPPKPYPVLPWPDHDDSPNMTKPFEATFNPNPLTIKPNQNMSTTLTIVTLDDTQLGEYTLFVELGEWKQTATGGVKFNLMVLPNQ